ncbi:hypothetical protein JHK87_003693 [Glycine soja]|nr:hypothetical protein JHK87_003693 [Glycine soja]
MIDPQASTNPVPQWRNLRSTCGGFRYHEYNREERCDNFGELDLVLLEKCKNVNHLKQAHAQVFTTGLDTNTFALSRLWLSAPTLIREASPMHAESLNAFTTPHFAYATP